MPAQRPEPKKQPKKKRWVATQNANGRTYYHNTENGTDQWEKPDDYDADFVAKPNFTPMSDGVKEACLLEHQRVESGAAPSAPQPQTKAPPPRLQPPPAAAAAAAPAVTVPAEVVGRATPSGASAKRSEARAEREAEGGGGSNDVAVVSGGGGGWGCRVS